MFKKIDPYWVMLCISAMVTFPCVMLKTTLYEHTIILSKKHEFKKKIIREVAQIRAKYEKTKVNEYHMTPPAQRFKRCLHN